MRISVFIELYISDGGDYLLCAASDTGFISYGIVHFAHYRHTGDNLGGLSVGSIRRSAVSSIKYGVNNFCRVRELIVNFSTTSWIIATLRPQLGLLSLHFRKGGREGGTSPQPSLGAYRNTTHHIQTKGLGKCY